MDQTDSYSNAGVRQSLLSNLSSQSSLHYATELFRQHNEEESSTIQSSIGKYEQDENESISMPILYKKRLRTKFSQEHLDVLEATFQQYHYPSVDVVDDLVEQLQLPTQKITVWFQNRRARLKKTQHRSDDQQVLDQDDQQQYDSGIHLDEDISHDSSRSPPSNTLIQLPPPPFIAAPSPYYLPNSHHQFYNPMWPNFSYPMSTPSLQPPVSGSNDMPYHLRTYPSSEIPFSFFFQDVNNYQHLKEFNGEL